MGAAIHKEAGGEDGARAAPEVVELAVGIGGRRERVCAKRSSLMMCQDSMLARMFDAERWAQATQSESQSSSDEDISNSDDESD